MSTISIAGGHGQIARHLTPLLVDGGHQVRSLIRDPGQSEDIRAWGGTPAVCDLEHAAQAEIVAAIDGSDAVVFAAGAGPGSGAERKESVDHQAAVALARACEKAGVPRYVMVSSMGTDDPPAGDEVFEVYLRAKAAADDAVMASGLDWSIIRPGQLTDDDPTGAVTLGRHVDRGKITRADVAAVLAAVLDRDDAGDLLVEVVGGSTNIDQALQSHITAGA